MNRNPFFFLKFIFLFSSEVTQTRNYDTSFLTLLDGRPESIAGIINDIISCIFFFVFRFFGFLRPMSTRQMDVYEVMHVRNGLASRPRRGKKRKRGEMGLYLLTVLFEDSMFLIYPFRRSFRSDLKK